MENPHKRWPSEPWAGAVPHRATAGEEPRQRGRNQVAWAAERSGGIRPGWTRLARSREGVARLRVRLLTRTRGLTAGAGEALSRTRIQKYHRRCRNSCSVAKRGPRCPVRQCWHGQIRRPPAASRTRAIAPDSARQKQSPARRTQATPLGPVGVPGRAAGRLSALPGDPQAATRPTTAALTASAHADNQGISSHPRSLLNPQTTPDIPTASHGHDRQLTQAWRLQQRYMDSTQRA